MGHARKLAEVALGRAAVALVLASLPLAAGAAPVSYEEAFAARIASPGDTGALDRYLDAALRAGMYDQAISSLEQHLITHPADAPAHLALAQLYSHVGSWELSLRHARFAQSLGSLGDARMQEAERLILKSERALAGVSSRFAVTVGVRAEALDFETGSPRSDRTDVFPFARLSGWARRDLRTPTSDAIVVSGFVDVTGAFTDFDFSGARATETIGGGRLAVTWDKGLPESGIESLRLALSGFGEIEVYRGDTTERRLGASARLSAAASVETQVYALGSLAWLGGSSGIPTEWRSLVEAGWVWTPTPAHGFGLAARASHDFASGDNIGHLVEVEASYGGQIYTSASFDWSHVVSVAYGDRDLPNLAGLPGETLPGQYRRANWSHRLQVSAANSVNAQVGYVDIDNDAALRDVGVFTFGLSFTHQIQ